MTALTSFGAGISREPPSNGPIWTEMQAGFTGALFDRMESEQWPLASGFPKDRKEATELNIRPEVFWRIMMETCGLGPVANAIRAADVGTPNQNHSLISALIVRGQCRKAITTNFDEHVERVLPKESPVAVWAGEGTIRGSEEATYIKLHGSVSSPSSLSFTLEDYAHLRDRNRHLLEFLVGRPLLIAGYSGFDTDVLPVLADAIDHVPCIVVVRHPGSRADQPILGLADGHSNVWILQARCQDVLGSLF